MAIHLNSMLLLEPDHSLNCTVSFRLKCGTFLTLKMTILLVICSFFFISAQDLVVYNTFIGHSYNFLLQEMSINLIIKTSLMLVPCPLEQSL